MTPQYRHAIVIGASSGIGEEIAKQLAAGGCKVAALGRRSNLLRSLADKSGGAILPFEHDVTDYGKIPLLFQEIAAALGGLDLVVYCAGYMPGVGPQEYEFEKDKEIFQINVIGAMAWLDQAAIRFDNVGAGTIIAIGSVAGDRGRAGQPAYNASKAALATFAEALRNRLDSKGVRVVTVKPGPTATPMTESLGLKNMMAANEAAALILRKSAKAGEHYLKLSHRVAFFIIRNIPSPLFRRLKI